MDRRQFIKDVFLWSAGATLAIPQFRIMPSALAAEKPQTLLSVAKGSDYTTLLSQVLAPLGGMAQFVKAGDKVVIKPNIGWDRNQGTGGQHQSPGCHGPGEPGPAGRGRKGDDF